MTTEPEQPEDSLIQQLRRRREAAWRLPSMPCGHRDPLDCTWDC